MVSLLESKIKSQVAAAFAGKLLTGTLRQVSGAALDAYGDLTTTTATTTSFDGIVDTFSVKHAEAVGVPVTDAKILIINGSTTATVAQDNQINMRSQWYQIRKIVERDPADATTIVAAYEIPDPT